MARTGPKLSPNPGRTAKFYRKNKKSRMKHRRTNRAINSTPAKKAYRRDLMKKGFMYRPNTTNAKLCQDIVPIVKVKPPKKDKKFGLF